MATTYRTQYIRQLRELETAIDRFHDELIAAVLVILLRYQNASGQIPVSERTRVRALVAQSIADFYGGRNAYTRIEGVLLPRSPFMRMLWTAIAAVAVIAVDQQAAIMRSAGITAVGEGTMGATIAALNGYQSPLSGERFGRTFDERLRRTAAETVRMIDNAITPLLDTNVLLAADAIREAGIHAGQRLARNETVAAYTLIALAAARLGGVVRTVEFRLGPRENHCAECLSMTGNVYPIEDAPYLPRHVYCLCYFVYRRGRHRPLDSVLTPLAGASLVNLLLRSRE